MAPANRLQFAANLNFLFTENGADLLERFRRAVAAGFRAVECGFAADASLADAVAVQRETGLQVALLNMCVGQWSLRFEEDFLLDYTSLHICDRCRERR